MQTKDREILRSLASRVAEIAALPQQQEKITLWKALNGLKPIRPMVLIDQIPWHEVDVDGELVLQTEDDFCRHMETNLRRTLYSWNHMRVDMVVEPVIDVGKVIYAASGFGLAIKEQTAVLDPQNDVVGHYYFDQLKTEEDLEKIRIPEMTFDEKATNELEEKAHDLFDGILTVRMQGILPWFSPWDNLAMWRGPENIIWDIADRPEFTHQIIRRLTEAHLAMLDQLEENGWLGYGQSTIHCSGAFTDELPAPGFQPEHPRAKDLWTAGMAQIFSTVSPAMHKEFELDYANKWYSRFGLVYYGCCEPLDKKMHLVKDIPHLRKISMSPWIDVERAAQQIGKDFVFSRKPSPAFLATDNWESQKVESDLSDTLEKCRSYECPLEFILKDISTVKYQPQRLWEWAETAMRVVEK